MRICFVETESAERKFFEQALGEQHELRFVEEHREVPADTEIVSVFIQSPVNGAFLDAHPSLKLVTTRSTTFDHIQLEECARRGVTACNVASYGDYTVAEHTFALLLALARRLRDAMGVHKGKAFSYEALRGFELREKTIGVIGTGRIGLHTIELAKGFSMLPIAYDISPQPELAKSLGFEYVPLDDLLRRSHIISLHCNLTPESHHIINSKALAKCMRGVVIINTARGGLIDTNALLEAIDSGVVGGAGVDVLEEERVLRHKVSQLIGEQIIERLRSGFSQEESRTQNPARIDELQALMHNEALLARPEVVFTPHVAFNSVEAIERISRATLHNIEAFVAGKPINVITPR